MAEPIREAASVYIPSCDGFLVSTVARLSAEQSHGIHAIARAAFHAL